jgi:hypothetical protein
VAGQELPITVRITNNKLGHDFPTGPLDIIQAWIELTVTDDQGNVVYTSGGLDDKRYIDPGSFMFKAEPVDRYGNLIDRHNLWEMVGIRYRRSLYGTTPSEPAGSKTARRRRTIVRRLR